MSLLRVTNDIMMAADAGDYSVLILLDLSSAFDMVDHKTLIDRLEVDVFYLLFSWFLDFMYCFLLFYMTACEAVGNLLSVKDNIQIIIIIIISSSSSSSKCFFFFFFFFFLWVNWPFKTFSPFV
ncbi:hypothetical protein LDENG_00078210 [Lucifuga dentata]|nr:hypothetical protein LDENG_00078210 [Lucifuga dentata]